MCNREFPRVLLDPAVATRIAAIICKLDGLFSDPAPTSRLSTSGGRAQPRSLMTIRNLCGNRLGPVLNRAKARAQRYKLGARQIDRLRASFTPTIHYHHGLVHRSTPRSFSSGDASEAVHSSVAKTPKCRPRRWD